MISLKNVSKTYRPKKGASVQALKEISIDLPEKGLVFVLGKSGCGKSTLLNCIGGLDTIDGGEIVLYGKSSAEFSQSDFDSYRNTYLGFIFQEYNIIQDFSVGANIALALELQGHKATDEKVNEILSQVDLTGYAHRKPNELSGGQKQRVAIARALVKDPKIILADEPTGALDSKTGIEVFDVLKSLSATRLVLVVSHDRDFAEQYADRIITLADGCVVDDVEKSFTQPTSVQEGLKIINDNVIHIEKGYHLTEQDVALIKHYIEQNKNDTIISLDAHANKEVFKAKRVFSQGVAVFERTKGVAKAEKDSFKVIRSRLPVKNCIKLGASALANKKFRLVLTILLSVFAFVMFGFADTMASYNGQKALENSIYDSNITYLSYAYQQREIYEQDALNISEEYWHNLYMSDDEIAVLSQKLGKEFKPVYDGGMSLSVPNRANANADYTFYYLNSFSGYIEADAAYLASLDFALTGAYPSNVDEIAITQLAYETYVACGYQEEGKDKTDIAKPSDLIGKAITVRGRQLKITGIIDTHYNQNGEYDMLKEEDFALNNLIEYAIREQRRSSELNNGYHALLFGCEGLIADVIADENGEILNMDSLNIDNFYINQTLGLVYTDLYEIYENATHIMKLSDLQATVNISWTGEAVTTLAEDELILPTEYNDEKYFYTNGATPTVQIGSWEDEVHKVYKVVGFYQLPENESLTDDEDDIVWVVPDALYNHYTELMRYVYKRAITPMPHDKLEIKAALAFSDEITDDKAFKMQNEVITTVQIFDSVFRIAKNVCMYIGIAFALFASLLFANYISVSITYKKKDIGILRAIGARSIDVYGIFLAESLLIAAANFVLATLITAICCIRVNLSVHAAGLPLSILNFGIRQIALLLGISLFVACAASFLPVFRMARKRPIDTINER